jgi:hypothetical protein
MEKVTSNNRATLVRDVLMDCLYKDEEITNGEAPEGTIVVEGIMNKMGLNPKKVELHRADIRQLLEGLPRVFYKQTGGGYSFLGLCEDAEGNQWGEHRNMDELCVLAQAVKMGSWCLPRDMWSALPDGMPYVVFDLT